LILLRKYILVTQCQRMIQRTIKLKASIYRLLQSIDRMEQAGHGTKAATIVTKYIKYWCEMEAEQKE